MADEKKKSFVFYGEWQQYFALLSIEKQSALIMAILDYFNKGILPDFEGDIRMAFTLMRTQMDRDAEKYERRCNASRQNGLKGGRPRKPELTEDETAEPTESEKTKLVFDEPKKADNVNDNDNDNVNVNDTNNAGKSPRESAQSIQLQRFNAFWQSYPKKVGKQAALKAWMKIKPTSELFGCIMSAIERYKRSPDWTKENGRFIPNPTTWLNQGRWDDEITEVNDYGAGQRYYDGGFYTSGYTSGTVEIRNGTPEGFKDD